MNKAKKNMGKEKALFKVLRLFNTTMPCWVYYCYSLETEAWDIKQLS